MTKLLLTITFKFCTIFYLFSQPTINVFDYSKKEGIDSNLCNVFAYAPIIQGNVHQTFLKTKNHSSVPLWLNYFAGNLLTEQLVFGFTEINFIFHKFLRSE